MRELSLFTGAGGGVLAGHLLGWRTVCAVEHDAYRAGVLAARQNDGSLPPFPIWDDIRTFDGRAWRGRVDVVSGGFPCQAFSFATAGKSTAEDLWPEQRRVVADVAAPVVFAENVTKEAIDRAADDLEQMGYVSRCCEVSAADMGADHIRSRFWLCAHAHGYRELLRPINAKMAGVPQFRNSLWATLPSESRMADGMANRMERLSATGDGQVPIVAAAASSAAPHDDTSDTHTTDKARRLHHGESTNRSSRPKQDQGMQAGIEKEQRRARSHQRTGRAYQSPPTALPGF